MLAGRDRATTLKDCVGVGIDSMYSVKKNACDLFYQFLGGADVSHIKLQPKFAQYN